MGSPAQRSRSLRRVPKSLPGGGLSVHYERRRPGRARCAICGGELHGVPRLRASRARGLAKTEKRPERPYGGVVCPQCLKRGLKAASRPPAGATS